VTSAWALPSLTRRWIPVWQRHVLVWRKLSVSSLVGNFGDPLLYLLALGYGLGRFVGSMDGMPYISFLASGIVCSSAMNTATFESLYSAFTRMTTQQTWAGMLATPLDVDDIVMGEMVWAGSKSLISAGAILIVAAALGIVHGAHALLVLPAALLVGTCFAAMALVVTAISKSYEFFLYYVTLVVTPMMLFCGVFFPLQGLPIALQWVAAFLPLTHAVELIRPLMTGSWPARVPLHLSVLLAYGATSYWAATALVRKRLLA
jgi:lipooligosaccharide transport system permease protein